MARNISSRTQSLRKRRAGTDRLDRLSASEQFSVLAKSTIEEPWLGRRSNQPYTRYALGAMQEVGPDYTRISIETAERVGNQLEKALLVTSRLQGSVPLNVHIRGISDVDLLTLSTWFITYETAGYRSRMGYYTSPTSATSLGVLSDIRQGAETTLKGKYPAATIDTSGGKAIKISGGSLARPVDVVPSHWHDTSAYQSSAADHDRGVTILNKKVPETVGNLPFLHIKRVSDKCDSCAGGVRKAIRLCKNVKADAQLEGTEIDLPSFDIAAIMYHLDPARMVLCGIYELLVLAETQRHLDALARDLQYAQTLTVPDGSRRIFDTRAKLDGLVKLSIEMDDLLREVAKENDSKLSIFSEPLLEDSRRAVSSLFIEPS